MLKTMRQALIQRLPTRGRAVATLSLSEKNAKALERSRKCSKLMLTATNACALLPWSSQRAWKFGQGCGCALIAQRMEKPSVSITCSIGQYEGQPTGKSARLSWMSPRKASMLPLGSCSADADRPG